MNQSEVKNALHLADEDISISEHNFLAIKDLNVFGEKSSETRFHFGDIKGKNPTLIAVEVRYPDDVNMDMVLKKMQKTYGSTVSEFSIFDYFTIFDDKLEETKYVEADHLKLWSSKKSILKYIPENEIEIYRELWSKYQTPVTEDENWKRFSNDGKLVSIAWTDDNEIPFMKNWDAQKNKLYFDALNFNVYNGIKNELADKQ
jgi:hypothetical protein